MNQEDTPFVPKVDQVYYVPYHTTTDLEPAAGWYFTLDTEASAQLPVGPYDTKQQAEEAAAECCARTL